jgi:hypothetical protein
VSQLCQLTDVQTYLGDSASSSAVALDALIENASAFIEQYCNRTFALANYTETRNGNGGNRLFLLNGPVVSVTAVSVNGQTIAAAPSVMANGWVNDDSMVYLRGGCFTRGFQNVTVAYSAGFATIPADVAQACIELVAEKFAKRNRIDKVSETLGTQQTQAYIQADMPARVKTALQPYIRWNLAS